MIIKRIYFPDDMYSKNENEFLKILKIFELSWQESIKKVYKNDKNVKLLTGIYLSPDKNRRIFAFYEGYEKPATFIVKILGGGGNFLIDLNSFCHNAGCILEDRDEQYVETVLSRLKNFGDIDVPGEVKKRKDGDKEKGENSRTLAKVTLFDIKLRRVVRKCLRRYIINNGKSLIRRGIGIKIVRLFKKKQVQNNIIWKLENGWMK